MNVAQLIEELRTRRRNIEVLIDNKYSIESLTYTFEASKGVTYISLNTSIEEGNNDNN